MTDPPVSERPLEAGGVRIRAQGSAGPRRGSPAGQPWRVSSETPSGERSPGRAAPAEEPLIGAQNAGSVVRVGDTVRRPRSPGSVVVESLLLHLENVGFDAAPRFRGIDDRGRQVLDFVAGDVYRQPPWQSDDAENAARLGELAALLARLHAATATFRPPAGEPPRRPLPIPGSTWTHGDPGYPNVVYDDTGVVALVDWEFAAPADPVCDPAALVALSVRGPRPDADDHPRREAATVLAIAAVAAGFAMSSEQLAALPSAAAAVLEDTAEFLGSRGEPGVVGNLRWRATWFREHADRLSAG